MPSTTPEQSQPVRVRGRNWTVTEVVPSELPPAERGTGARPVNWVSLECVDYDGRGDQLQVLWELEPTARVIQSQDLPAPVGVDDPADMEVFLRAVRWGATSTADLSALQSPFRSGVSVEEYQLDPLVRAIEMPRANLLIADDVGLGKTIEAGLVIQEFLVRHRARTVLIISPSPIQTHWKIQLLAKFGLEFRIIDSEAMRDLRRRRGVRVNPWAHFPRLITSMDFIKRPEHLRRFRELFPARHERDHHRRFDLLIVDEAHNVTPRGKGKYPVDSLRTQAIREISAHFEHRLFLSATPHDGDETSFTALLELVDPRRFVRGVEPDDAQKQAVVIRRLKSDEAIAVRPDGERRFPERVVDCIPVPFTDEERQAHQDLQELTDSKGSGKSSVGGDLVLKMLKKRLFSSPRAFDSTLRKFEASLERAARSDAGAEKRLQRYEEELDDPTGDLFEDEETIDGALRAARDTGAGLRTGGRERLERLKAWAERGSGRPDAKFEALVEFIERELRAGGNWTDRRLIIFTEFTATLVYLKELFAARGWTADDRIGFIDGGTRTEDRERLENAFRADPADAPIRILVATDTASEGIDLQTHCDLMVHYEIPWRPTVMEQRNGRIDRYGQPSERVRILHFVDASFRESRPDGEPGSLAGDLEFHFRAVKKLERMERDLFGKVSPVIAAQVEEAMLGRRRLLRTDDAEKQGEKVRRSLRVERNLQERITRLHERLEETRRILEVDPGSIRAVVEVGLRLALQPPLVPAELDGVPVFRVPALTGAWSRLRADLPHPHTGNERPISFDPAFAVGRDDVVLAHLHHPLVQQCVRLVRAQIWSDESGQRLHRVTVRRGGTGDVRPRAIAHARLVVVGRDGRSLHEELIEAGGEIDGGRLRRTGVNETRDALAGSTPLSRGVDLEPLQEWWTTVEEPLRRALRARADERADAITTSLAKRCEKEKADVESHLRDLERTIREELAEVVEEGQLDLFASEERDQWEYDRAHLEQRLDQIPHEIERERAAIDEHFADPRPILFPVAVTWIVPEGGTP